MLSRRLARLAFRLRLRRARAGALDGLTWGFAAAILALIVSKVVSIGPVGVTAAGLVALGAFAGAALRFARKIPLREAAAFADLGAGSDEVISTALETPHEGRFGAEVLARSRDSQLLPRSSWRVSWTGVALALVAAALVPVPAIRVAAADASLPAAISPAVLKALERTAKEMKRIGDQTSNPEVRQIG